MQALIVNRYINDRLLLGLLMFFYINSLTFKHFEFLTTTRLVLIGLLMYGLLRINSIKINSSIVLAFFLYCIISIYSFFQGLFIDSDYIQFSRLVHFQVYCLVGAVLFASLIKNEREFHSSIVLASIIQSFFAILTYRLPELNDVIFSIFWANEPIVSTLHRAPGLSSSSGSAMGLVISLGSISLYRLSHGDRRLKYLFMSVFILFSQIIVSRLGLIISMIYLLMLVKKDWKFYRAYGVVFFQIQIVFVLGLLFYFLKGNNQLDEYTLSWAFSGGAGVWGTAKAILNMGIPDMELLHSLFGMGVISSESGLNASGSDSGYIQTYYSIGIFFALLFYLGLLFVSVMLLRGLPNKLFFVLLIVLVFVVELKEPFIFKYSLPFYLITSLLIYRNSCQRHLTRE